jgi:hypothetical protein
MKTSETKKLDFLRGIFEFKKKIFCYTIHDLF